MSAKKHQSSKMIPGKKKKELHGKKKKKGRICCT